MRIVSGATGYKPSPSRPNTDTPMLESAFHPEPLVQIRSFDKHPVLHSFSCSWLNQNLQYPAYFTIEVRFSKLGARKKKQCKYRAI